MNQWHYFLLFNYNFLNDLDISWFWNNFFFDNKFLNRFFYLHNSFRPRNFNILLCKDSLFNDSFLNNKFLFLLDNNFILFNIYLLYYRFLNNFMGDNFFLNNKRNFFLNNDGNAICWWGFFPLQNISFSLKFIQSHQKRCILVGCTLQDNHQTINHHLLK